MARPKWGLRNEQLHQEIIHDKNLKSILLIGQNYGYEGRDIYSYLNIIKQPVVGNHRKDTHQMWKEIIAALLGYKNALIHVEMIKAKRKEERG